MVNLYVGIYSIIYGRWLTSADGAIVSITGPGYPSISYFYTDQNGVAGPMPANINSTYHLKAEANGHVAQSKDFTTGNIDIRTDFNLTSAMPIRNGTFNTDISGWTPSGTGNYDVIWSAGRARLRIYKCSNAYMEQTFVIDKDTLTFDWQTLSDNWYESPGWNLIIGGTTVISEGFSIDRATGFSGTKTVNVSPYMGQTATIKFQVIPSIYCANTDHANTYLWVDNVTLTNTIIGTLDIRTHDVNNNPITGANIFIDDVVQPVLTPAIITGLSTGSHRLKLTKTGYIDTFATTNINLNQTTIEDLVLVLAVVNITATDIVISPGPYIQPSTITATIIWQNTGTLRGSFDPAIIISKSSDGTITHMNIGSMTTLDPTQSTTQISFTVPDLVKDTYTICPDPN